MSHENPAEDADGGAKAWRQARRYDNDPAKRVSVKDDQRDRFARDRDRILYCSAFRRLAGVTQVVGADEGHVFHNRLTHSMKAAQVGRRLAERFEGREGIDVEPEVVEAAALAHDLGHPPFGHTAESALDELLRQGVLPDGARMRGQVDGFEGNAQTFRILTKLACHRAEYSGLDLTRATLCAVIKYPWYEGEHPEGKRKWNAYRSEKDDFEFAKLPDHGKSNEAKLMEYADDIAYSVHDLEDFYRAGWVPLQRLATDAQERGRFVKRADVEWSGGLSALLARGILDSILDEMLPEPLREPYTGTVLQRAELRRFTSRLIGRYVQGVTVENTGNTARVVMPKDHEQEIAVLKQLMVHYVFRNPALAAQQHGHRRIVRELFHAFYLAAHQDDPGSILPAGLRDLLVTLLDEARSDDESAQIRTRIAADSVASLTEQEAIALHRRLSGFDGRAVRDPIL